MLHFVVSVVFINFLLFKNIINILLGVVIMDGPMIAFVYQNASKASEDIFVSFDENNTYIVLWRPLLQKNALCTLAILAHNIQGFWLPRHDIANDVDEP